MEKKVFDYDYLKKREDGWMDENCQISLKINLSTIT